MIKLLEAIASEGKLHKSSPHLRDVDIFKPFFKDDSLIDLDAQDASNCTRRELLCRFLLLNATLDQGPDMEGVRQLLVNTLNNLYKKEIRILHTPKLFFDYLNEAISNIDFVHNNIIKERERDWQLRNNSKKHYNLFIDGTTQTLSYAVFRWGTPLAVPLTLNNIKNDNPQTFVDFLKSFSSSEKMSKEIKNNRKYGLGKAIGDKAAHLFAKWIIYSYPLLNSETDKSWGQYSYEVPFDSNAGRVLWRTGFFLHYVTEQELKNKQFIQEDKGKNKKKYLRITNCRGINVSQNIQEINIDNYNEICIECLKVVKSKPRKVELQRVPAALLYDKKQYTIGELDDGLMYIGTNFCFNHDKPKCSECPLKNICAGNINKKLITEYFT